MKVRSYKFLQIYIYVKLSKRFLSIHGTVQNYFPVFSGFKYPRKNVKMYKQKIITHT